MQVETLSGYPTQVLPSLAHFKIFPNEIIINKFEDVVL